MKKRTQEQLEKIARDLTERYGETYRVCEYCGKIFKEQESLAYYDTYEFCSYECKDDYDKHAGYDV